MKNRIRVEAALEKENELEYLTLFCKALRFILFALFSSLLFSSSLVCFQPCLLPNLFLHDPHLLTHSSHTPLAPVTVPITVTITTTATVTATATVNKRPPP